MAIGLRHGNIQVWNLNEVSLKYNLKAKSKVLCLYSLRNNYLASGTGYPDNSIHIWDISNESLIHTFDSKNAGHHKEVNVLTLLDEEKSLIASDSNDRSIKVWRI